MTAEKKHAIKVAASTITNKTFSVWQRHYKILIIPKCPNNLNKYCIFDNKIIFFGFFAIFFYYNNIHNIIVIFW